MMTRRRALLAGMLLWPAICAAETPPPFTFSLQNGAGKTVTQAQFHGRYLLVFFGYTRCADLCPTTLFRLARAIKTADPLDQTFDAIFVTVDPRHDSPKTVAHYASLFSPRIEGLGGSPQQIQNTITAFHTYVSWPNGPNGQPTHSGLIYILSPSGQLATVLPDGLSIAALTRALRRYHVPSHSAP